MADHSAPVNGGLLLLTPNRSLYSDGVRVLRACLFNTSHGWMGAGPPRSIAAAVRSSLRDGAPLLRGGPIARTLTLTLALTLALTL